MKMISSKSKVILAKIGIPIYVKRDNLGQNFLNTIILHKRDKILALLELPLIKHTKEEQDLFISIMNTMTCQKPLIEEFSKSFNPKDTKELSSVIQMASNKTNGIISFGIPINTTTKFIQAPSLSSIIDNPDLKKPLWEKIKKTFINK
jgi:DNA polymerase III psi subunit